MTGLYARDYQTLTQEEIAERDRLEDAIEIAPDIYSKKSCYFDYPKAIRHNMSLFPNNFMDHIDLRERALLEGQCADFLNFLEDETITELDVKRFLQKNRYYHIPASILTQYPFGHHGAYVFKEFSLGTSYIADYVLVGGSSDGYQFVFVEFENPYNRIVMADGDFGDTIRKGINQVNDWKGWISAHFSTLSAEFRKYTPKQIPDEFNVFDPTRFNYVIVAGRRKDFNEKTRRLRRQLANDSKIKILHYDNMHDYATGVIGNPTYSF